MSAAPVVLFDLDDTLLDHRGAVTKGILRHVADQREMFGEVDEHRAASLWHALEERHYHRYLSGELDMRGQRRARVIDFAAAHAVAFDDATADAWFDGYFLSYRSSWELFADALPCLDRLAASGARLGIITNGEHDYQAAKLDRLGILDRFEHLIASGSLGIAKPDARIFRHACSLFDADPRETGYIGDRLLTDAVGAADAGLTGVWLNRHGDELPEGAIGHGHSSAADPSAITSEKDVRVIASLDELAGVLR